MQPDETLERDAWYGVHSPIADETAAGLHTATPLGSGGIAKVPSLEERLNDQWGRAFRDLGDRRLKTQNWVAECVANGYQTLTTTLTIDPDIRGGVPVLKGTRFTAAQALAELAETSGVTEFADEFDVDADVVRDMLMGLSLILHRPCSK